MNNGSIWWDFLCIHFKEIYWASSTCQALSLGTECWLWKCLKHRDKSGIGVMARSSLLDSDFWQSIHITRTAEGFRANEALPSSRNWDCRGNRALVSRSGAQRRCFHEREVLCGGGRSPWKPRGVCAWERSLDWQGGGESFLLIYVG